MDFKLTVEQRALKQEFEDFFRVEMKPAPKTTGGLEALLASEESWRFHRTSERSWVKRAQGQGILISLGRYRVP